MAEHQITPNTPVYVGLSGYDTSDMYVAPGRGGVGPRLWRPTLVEDRPTGAGPAVRILPGDILDIDGIGRFRVEPRKVLEPRLIPA